MKKSELFDAICRLERRMESLEEFAFSQKAKTLVPETIPLLYTQKCVHGVPFVTCFVCGTKPLAMNDPLRTCSTCGTNFNDKMFRCPNCFPIEDTQI